MVYEETINRRCIVANRYLRFKVEISIKSPLPAGFFQKRFGGGETWIQFKYERLADFCFKCGMLEHVTGKCSFTVPATITSGNGIATNLFGMWLKAENAGSLLFINPEEEKGERGSRRSKMEKIIVPAVAQISKSTNLDVRLERCLTGTTQLLRKPEIGEKKI